jgi:cytochrome c-type biogenesis protein CcmH/NrfG
MGWKALRDLDKGFLGRLGRLLILLFLVLGVAVVAVIAWLNMNLVTFALFALVFFWIGRHEWRHHYKGIDDTVDVAEKRLWALEERAGLGEAWLEELKSARLSQRLMGGTLAENVNWPQERGFASEWKEWEAKYQAAMKEMPADGVGYNQWKKRVEQIRAERPKPDEEDELIAEVERELDEMPGDSR